MYNNIQGYYLQLSTDSLIQHGDKRQKKQKSPSETICDTRSQQSILALFLLRYSLLLRILTT